MQATIHKADNLDMLKKLPDNTIDLIYCDILYGTGRNFKDYQDLKPKREIIVEHYEPRLREMHRVLKDTGSIYLQMDTRINHWVRVIMDQVWGYENFRNEIVWRYSVNYLADTYPHDTDRILYYSKTSNFIYNQQYKSSEAMEKRLSKYLTEKDDGFYYWQGRNLKGSNWIRKIRHEDFIAENNLQEYFYERKYEGVRISELWNDIGYVARGNESVNYPTQKPKALLERIIKASSNEGDLVADFYAGSHTTGEVACELGRRYIGVDIGERSYEIGQERLKKWL